MSEIKVSKGDPAMSIEKSSGCRTGCARVSTADLNPDDQIVAVTWVVAEAVS